MRLCYVAPDVPVPHTGTLLGGSTHVLEISKALADFGNEVHIISRRMKGQSSYEQLNDRIFVHRVYRGLVFPLGDTPSRVHKVKTNFEFLKKIYLLCLYRIIIMLFTAAILIRYQIDAVLERNGAHGIGVFAGYLLSIPSAVEVIDLDYSKTSLLIAKKVFVYRKETLGDFPPDKIEIITAGVDAELFRPDVDAEYLRDKLGLKDKKVVVYVGELSAWHGVEDLLEAARRLENNVRVIMLGKNVEKLRDEVNESKEIFVFTGFVPYAEVPKYIALADVAVAPYNPKGAANMDRHGFYFSPLKLFEYMACAKPVVTTNVEIVSELLKEHRCGVLVEPGNAEELSEAIMYLLKNREKAVEMGKRGREAVLGRYTWKRVAEQVYSGMRGIVKNGNV